MQSFQATDIIKGIIVFTGHFNHFIIARCQLMKTEFLDFT